MITLITPTGGRPQAFALCEYWMSRQDSEEEIQWLVIDDGKAPTCVTHDQEYFRREPKKSDPSHTLQLNLITLLSQAKIRGDKVLFIEDDDYYAPNYLSTMSQWLNEGELAGERGAKYYFLNDRAWYYWTEHEHASLCRTGFRRSALPTLKKTLQSMRSGDWRVDLEFWSSHQGSKKLVRIPESKPALCLGIKQLPGRSGITHKRYPKSISDPNLKQLKTWIGEDFRYYQRFVTQCPQNLVVYTSVFGGYDNLGKAPTSNSYVITDGKSKIDPSWKVIILDREFKTPKLASRYCKMNAHLFFPQTWTLYLDANLKLLKPAESLVSHMMQSSPNSQAWFFKHNRSKTIRDEVETIVRFGFAFRHQVDTQLTKDHSKLPVAWGGCILRKPESNVSRFNELWWKTFSEGNYGRDQVLLPIFLQEAKVRYNYLDEPTPFYGETSQWFQTAPHLGKRAKY